MSREYFDIFKGVRVKAGRPLPPVQRCETTTGPVVVMRHVKSSHEELLELRQRQRDLGLMDADGNLYNPSTKTWISGFLKTEDETKIYDDLEYFSHYPEVQRGLPLVVVTMPEQTENENSAPVFKK